MPVELFVIDVFGQGGSGLSYPDYRLLSSGVHHFNRGEYFEAHEAWEILWRKEKDQSQRKFFQGLIQIAAGFHKLVVHKNHKGADWLLKRGIDKIGRFSGSRCGLDLRSFRESVLRYLGKEISGQVEPLASDKKRVFLKFKLRLLDGKIGPKKGKTAFGKAAS